MTEPQNPEPADAQPAPDGEAPAAHPVTDRYVARRLAEGAAAREAAEREEAALAALHGEAPPQGAFAFYVILGILISILLLVVILQTAGRSPAPPSAAPVGAVTSPR
jgi:hypothetical protein